MSVRCHLMPLRFILIDAFTSDIKILLFLYFILSPKMKKKCEWVISLRGGCFTKRESNRIMLSMFKSQV